MEIKRVGELMIPLDSFPCIPYWFTLRQALAELQEAGVKRANQQPLPWLLLVFNARNQLLGIVRRREILHGLKPSLQPDGLKDYHPTPSDAGTDPNLYLLGVSPKKAMQALQVQVDRQIIEFMVPIQSTVDYNDVSIAAIHMMIERDISFLPVVREGQIVGLVYADDVIYELISQVG
jgi:CBS-domain-containing membrane protein